MANITLNSLIIAVVWFLVMMVILQPIVTLVTPTSFSAQYFGTKNTITCATTTNTSGCGIVNSTYANFQNKIQIPLKTQAAGSAGFNASFSLNVFSALAFVYGAFGAFFGTMMNLPNMIYVLFVGSASYVTLIPISIAVIGSIALLMYVVISLVMKLISVWMKSDVEQVGG